MFDVDKPGPDNDARLENVVENENNDELSRS